MNTKKIALFGATTPIGKSILTEALYRGHFVTVITPDVNAITTYHDNLKVVEGYMEDVADVSAEVEGHDIVINAESPDPDNVEFYIEKTISLIAGMMVTGVKRLIVVGPYKNINDSSSIKEVYNKSLLLYQNEKDLNWSFLYPEENNDKSNDDFVLALLNEAEKSQHAQEAFAVNY